MKPVVFFDNGRFEICEDELALQIYLDNFAQGQTVKILNMSDTEIQQIPDLIWYSKDKNMNDYQLAKDWLEQKLEDAQSVTVDAN